MRSYVKKKVAVLLCSTELGLCLPSNSSILPHCMFINDCKSTRIDLGVSEHVNLQTQNLQMKRPDYI